MEKKGFVFFFSNMLMITQVNNMQNALHLVAMVTCIFVVLVKFICICLKAYMVWLIFISQLLL